MGLFDIFKKKEEPQPVRNNPNSVFTLRFTIPYFQIFDKTDSKLSALPIKMGVTGSCQYRISEPDLCFDNVPLGEMSPEQLDAHVKDALTMNVKTFFNHIETIPVLQFESAIAKISEGTKARITPILNDEFGISLRAFSISGVRYDTEDPNYLRLQTISQKIMEGRAQKVDATNEADIEAIKVDSELATKTKKTNIEIELERKQKEHELELERQRDEYNLDYRAKRIQVEALETEAELEAKRREQQLELERTQKEKEIESALTDKEAERRRAEKEHELELELKRMEAETARKKAEKDIEVQGSALNGMPSLDSSDSSFDIGGLDDDFKL